VHCACERVKVLVLLGRSLSRRVNKGRCAAAALFILHDKEIKKGEG
jgi:hypothetical protein